MAVAPRFGSGTRVLVSLGTTGILLVLLQDIYRPWNVDDAWFSSFVWNWAKHGVLDRDLLFASREGQGMVGVNHFGMIWAAIHALFFEALGWSRNVAHLPSCLLVLATVALWQHILETALASRLAGLVGAVILGASPPFLGAATQPRPEALAFFFISLAIWLAQRNRWVAAGLLNALAFECHPAGALGVFWVLPFLYVLDGQRRRAGSARFLLGLTAGSLVYVLLHFRFLGTLPHALLAGSEASGRTGHFLAEYFFKTRYLRHVPEFVIFALAGIGLFRSGHDRKTLGDWPWCVALGAGALLFARPIIHYTVYLYPLFLCWTLLLATRTKVVGKVLLCGLLAIDLGIVGVIWVRNHNFSSAELSQAFVRAIPQDGLAVVGPPEAWFALKDRLLPCTRYSSDVVDRIDRDVYWIDGPTSCAGAPPLLERLKARAENQREIATVESGVETYRILRLSLRPQGF